MLGPFLFTTAVAATIGTAIVTRMRLTPLSIVVAMGAAISLVFVATRCRDPDLEQSCHGGRVAGSRYRRSWVFLPSSFPARDTFIEVGILRADRCRYRCHCPWHLHCSHSKGISGSGSCSGQSAGRTLVIPLLMLAGVLKISGLLAIVLFIFISPLIGMVGAFLFNVIISHLFHHSRAEPGRNGSSSRCM